MEKERLTTTVNDDMQMSKLELLLQDNIRQNVVQYFLWYLTHFFPPPMVHSVSTKRLFVNTCLDRKWDCYRMRDRVRATCLSLGRP